MSYIFGGNTGLSAADAAQLRDRAQAERNAMARAVYRRPIDLLDPAAYLAAQYLNDQSAEEGERLGRQAANEAFASIMDALHAPADVPLPKSMAPSAPAPAPSAPAASVTPASPEQAGPAGLGSLGGAGLADALADGISNTVGLRADQSPGRLAAHVGNAFGLDVDPQDIPTLSDAGRALVRPIDQVAGGVAATAAPIIDGLSNIDLFSSPASPAPEAAPQAGPAPQSTPAAQPQPTQGAGAAPPEIPMPWADNITRSMPDGFSYDENDADILARTMLGEDNYEEGWRNVGAVVLNRTSDPRWPSDVSDVALQPLQFSAWNTEPGMGGNDRVRMPAEREEYQRARALADAMLEDAATGFYRDDTGGADHYYAPGVMDEPRWWNRVTSRGASSGGRQVGAHRFAGQVAPPAPVMETPLQAPAPASQPANARSGAMAGNMRALSAIPPDAIMNAPQSAPPAQAQSGAGPQQASMARPGPTRGSGVLEALLNFPSEYADYLSPAQSAVLDAIMQQELQRSGLLGGGQQQPEKLHFAQVDGRIVGLDPYTGQPVSEYGMPQQRAPEYLTASDPVTGQTIYVDPQTLGEVARIGTPRPESSGGDDRQQYQIVAQERFRLANAALSEMETLLGPGGELEGGFGHLDGSLGQIQQSDAYKRYEALFNQASDVLLRDSSGAALNEDEVQLFRDTYRIRSTDSRAMIQFRLRLMRRAVESIAGKTGVEMSELMPQLAADAAQLEAIAASEANTNDLVNAASGGGDQ